VPIYFETIVVVVFVIDVVRVVVDNAMLKEATFLLLLL
jgi:hypothetical protein